MLAEGFIMTKTDHHQSPPVPREYAGKWIAWDREKKRIVAAAVTLAEAKAAAHAAGETEPILAKAPKQPAVMGLRA